MGDSCGGCEGRVEETGADFTTKAEAYSKWKGQGEPELPGGIEIPNIYECTIVEVKGHVRVPKLMGGKPITVEVLDQSRSRARFAAYMRWKRVYNDLRMADVLCREVTKVRKRVLGAGYQVRLEKANEALQIIACHGGRMFSSSMGDMQQQPDESVSFFWISPRRDVWFIDSFTKKGNLVQLAHWDWFSGNLMMRGIIEALDLYIRNRSAKFPLKALKEANWGYALMDQERAIFEIQQMLMSWGLK